MMRPQAARPMATLAPTLTLPRNPPRYRFVLTPLADAMFQLLIFFMLSSGLTPYSLLTLRAGEGTTVANSSGTGTTSAQTATAFGDIAIWTITPDGLQIRGQDFPFSALPDLSAAIPQEEDASILLILRETAMVQDLTFVLEALTAAGITNVQVAEAPT